ncbi:MAG: transcription antitermination factor NusB [Pseudomonadota bacterium]
MSEVAKPRPRRKSKKQRPTTQTSDAKPGLASRRTGARLLGAIMDAKTPMDALTDDHHGHPDYLRLEPRDRSLVRAILMAALKHRADIDAILTTLLDRPLPGNATSLKHLLHVAITQILFLDIPDHSAVDLAVDAANADPRNRRFASLVNAICRRTVRSKEKLLIEIKTAPRHGPAWFFKMLESAYGPDAAAAIMTAHRQPGYIDLTLKRDAECIDQIKEAVSATSLHGQSLRLTSDTLKSAEITKLPGFADGAFWVQDVGASIPATLLGDVAEKRVLDACAAPGGKTAQLLDARAQVTALDISKNRLKRLGENIERLQLSEGLTTVCSSLFDFRPEEKFDAILLDTPCSSTGTIRRHPDVPWVKSDDDVVKLAELQFKMLESAAMLLAPGGRIVFSNCSIDPREGEQLAEKLMNCETTTLIADPIQADEISWLRGAVNANGQVRTTPVTEFADPGITRGIDGFFAVRFRAP